MKTRLTLVSLILTGLLAAFPASAQGMAEEIARQMRRQGFEDIHIAQTWLGRMQITGTRSGGTREIVVNPNTGEILRDLWLNAQGQMRAADIDFDDDDAEDAADDAEDAAEDARDDAEGSRGGSSGKGGGDGGGKGGGKGGGDD